MQSEPQTALSNWASIATIAAAIIGVLTLLYTAYQVHRNTQVSRGQFWLELEKMFAKHDEVHLKLRPGGEWSSADQGPSSPGEWSQVEDYMGLLEHCEIMLRKRLIDLDTFKSIFGYRVRNLLANKVIVREKLIRRKEAWGKFISLVKSLEMSVPETDI